MCHSKVTVCHSIPLQRKQIKRRIGNENEVEVRAIFVMPLNCTYMPDFLWHVTFHSSRCYILLYSEVILILHIKKSCTLKKMTYSLAMLRLKTLGRTQYKMLMWLRKTEVKGQCGLICFAQGHIGSVELKDKLFMFHFCGRE